VIETFRLRAPGHRRPTPSRRRSPQLASSKRRQKGDGPRVRQAFAAGLAEGPPGPPRAVQLRAGRGGGAIFDLMNPGLDRRLA
jgi:hypothetical protein